MGKVTQKEMIKQQLLYNGFVSRNWALQKFCSRLSAIIYKLKKEGYIFSEGYKKIGKAKDYRYYLINRPKNVWSK